MAANDYHFVTHWKVEATPDEVYDVLSDAGALANWWPSVYLQVDPIASGDEEGLGATYQTVIKGLMPHRLRWQSTVTALRRPEYIEIQAHGDLEGVGRSVIRAGEDGTTEVEFDWRVRAEEPFLKFSSYVLKPAFGWNHNWAMERGEESLKLEIARRRAHGDATRLADIEPPPGPANDRVFWFAVGASAVFAAGVVKVLTARRRV